MHLANSNVLIILNNCNSHFQTGRQDIKKWRRRFLVQYCIISLSECTFEMTENIPQYSGHIQEFNPADWTIHKKKILNYFEANAIKEMSHFAEFIE